TPSAMPRTWASDVPDAMTKKSAASLSPRRSSTTMFSPLRDSIAWTVSATTSGNGLRPPIGRATDVIYSGLGSDLHLHFGVDVVRQSDGDRMLAQLLDRVLERDLALVDVVTLGRELLGDVGRGDRAEELAVLTGLGAEAELHLGKAGGQCLGLTALGGVAGLARLVLGGDPLLVSLGGLESQPVRQQVVAGVARLDLHQVARLAERGDGLTKNQFDHGSAPSGGAIRRRMSSQVSASPIRVAVTMANGNKTMLVIDNNTANALGAGSSAVRITASPLPA